MVQAKMSLRNFLDLKIVFWLLFILVTTALLWSIFFELNKAIVAPGQVSPEGRAVKIQNATSGTIADTLIKVGDNINRDEIVIIFDTKEVEQKLSYLRKRQEAVSLEIARLAETINLPGGFASLPASDNYYYKIQASVLAAEFRDLMVQIDVIEQSKHAKAITLKLLESQIPIIQKSIELSKAKLRLVTEMQQMGFEGNINVLEAEADYNNAQDKIISHKNEIELITNEISQSDLEIQKIESERFLNAALKHYELTSKLDQIQAEIDELNLTLNNSTVKSPISGTISRILFENIGQVIEPGTTLAEILPEDIENVLYVEVPIDAISEVKIGQPGTISLANMDARSNSQLLGTLTQLDGDVTIAEDGRKYYSGIVEFEEPTSKFLVPGVAGTVALSLGKRSVFLYVFDPIVDVLKNSLQE